VDGAEAELLLELSLDRNLLHLLDAEWDLAVRARAGGTNEPPEPRDQASFVRLDLVIRADQGAAHDQGGGYEPDSPSRSPERSGPGE